MIPRNERNHKNRRGIISEGNVYVNVMDELGMYGLISFPLHEFTKNYIQ